MRRGRSVDDFELEGARLMQIVELLQRGESFGAGELGGQAFVERIVENSAAQCRIGNEALDDRVPRARNVEHHRGQLKLAVESGRRKLSRTDSRRLAAEAREPERVAQPLRRIDGNHCSVEAGGGARERECGGNSRLTDAAGAEQNRNRAFAEEIFQAGSR